MNYLACPENLSPERGVFSPLFRLKFLPGLSYDVKHETLLHPLRFFNLPSGHRSPVGGCPRLKAGIMNVSLKPFDFARAAARAGIDLPSTGPAAGKAVDKPGSFQGAMSKALKEVSQAQLNASAMQREVTLDNPTVSIEQTMVAMQKAQVAFQATLQTRNKLVQAYSEIMNMQV